MDVKKNEERNRLKTQILLALFAQNVISYDMRQQTKPDWRVMNLYSFSRDRLGSCPRQNLSKLPNDSLYEKVVSCNGAEKESSPKIQFSNTQFLILLSQNQPPLPRNFPL